MTIICDSCMAPPVLAADDRRRIYRAVADFFAATTIVSSRGGSVISLTDPGVLRTVVGSSLYLTVVVVIGLALGALLRKTAAASRDVIVGEVLGYDIGNGLGPVTVKIFVRAPYDQLVRPQSHFWNSSGISVGFPSRCPSGLM